MALGPDSVPFYLPHRQGRSGQRTEIAIKFPSSAPFVDAFRRPTPVDRPCRRIILNHLDEPDR